MTMTPEDRTRGPSDPRFVPNLQGLTGRLCLCVQGEPKLLLDINDGTARVYTKEPETSWWMRFKADALGLLPIHSML